jgi:lysophospholipid acyltransferase (LPLAT)-like uncharacterized protein
LEVKGPLQRKYHVENDTGVGRKVVCSTIRGEAEVSGDRHMSTSFGVSQFRLAYVAGLIAASLLRLQYLTWQKDLREASRIDRMIADGERVLGVFWHGKYFPLFSLMAGRRLCVFASDSFRGRVIAEICRRFGYECVILPNEGGLRSRNLIIETLRSRNAAALAIDGPLGPQHRVKRGALDIASSLGFVIVPVSASARKRRILTRRWDQREIPRLFTRIALTVGEPLKVPSLLGLGDIRLLRSQVQSSLEALSRRADELVCALPSGKWRAKGHQP